jgi:RNA polymerase sigma-70 factor (ECF subfamily)
MFGPLTKVVFTLGSRFPPLGYLVMDSLMANSEESLLAEAKAGSRESLGDLLQLFSNYLHVLAVGQMGRRLQTRVSTSDVVQETFLEAHQGFPQFRGTSVPEFYAWLRKILVNNLHRAIEMHIGTQKRDLRREVSLDALAHSLDQSTTRLDAILPDRELSPSRVFAHHELQLQIANTLAQLPPDYRYVLILRHLESMPFEEVAKRMERSVGAVRMLWLRAIEALRHEWKGGSSA